MVKYLKYIDQGLIVQPAVKSFDQRSNRGRTGGSDGAPPGLGVDGLPDGAEDAQGGQVVLEHCGRIEQWSKCGQNVVKMWSKCGPNVVKMWSIVIDRACRGCPGRRGRAGALRFDHVVMVKTHCVLTVG